MKTPILRSLLLTASLLLCSLGASFGQLSSGLLNYWPLDANYNDTAGTVSGASSTANDHGTPQVGATLVTDATTDRPAGSYLNCNRAAGSSWVGVPNSTDILMAGRSLTISAWFRVPAFAQNWQALIAHGEGTDYRIARRGGDQVLGYAGGVGDIPGSAIGTVASGGAWHHVVAITEAGVSTRLWVDGSLVATGGVPNLTDSGSTQLMIGGNPQGDTGAAVPTQYRSWGGDIDDVGMWSRPLTPAEIGTIYTSGRTGSTLGALMAPTDTDGDGLPNSWEITHSLDPNDNGTTDPVNGPSGNPDNDGLTNLQEFNTGTLPRDDDTDNDGLMDGPEVTNHLTNPLVPDTDGDGLSDGAEVTTHLTNPVLGDTDGDGITDGGEIAKGTNPAVADTGFDFGLVGYWPMDANVDSSVGTFPGSSMGTAPITMAPGKFGNAVALDGIDQYISVGGDENALDFAGQSMTVSAWFTADSLTRSWQGLMGKGDASSEWRIHRRDALGELSACAGSADVPAHATALQVGTGAYHHVVLVSETGVSARLYMDGVLVSTAPAPTLTGNANAVRFGDNAGAPGRFWHGKIDDVAMWCRPLSGAEIAQIYNTGTGTPIEDLIGTPIPLDFTQTQYDKLTNEWTLTWNSKPGRTYRLNYSTDLVDFSSDIDDAITSQGSSTTFGPFANPIPLSGSRVYFKVTENWHPDPALETTAWVS